MASAEGEVPPTAAELLLLDEMAQVRDDWENPMHSWCALVAGFASKNPFRISRMIRLAKTSPWTQDALQKELSTALGQQTMLDSVVDYGKDYQLAFDLEDAANWAEEQEKKQMQLQKEQMAHDAKQWELMHPPRYTEEVASTQVIYDPGDESDSHFGHLGSDDQPLS